MTSSCFKKPTPFVNYTQTLTLNHSITSTLCLYLFIITSISLLGEHDLPDIFIYMVPSLPVFKIFPKLLYT